MASADETWADRAWQWVLKFSGLGVFLYAARQGSDTSYGIAFLGILLAVFSVKDVRSILRAWRRNGKEGPPSP